jgi:hypothetical protein
MMVRFTTCRRGHHRQARLVSLLILSACSVPFYEPEGSAPPCPSLPERPSFRTPGRRSGRRLPGDVSRRSPQGEDGSAGPPLRLRRSPLLRPPMPALSEVEGRRALRQFRGIVGAAPTANGCDSHLRETLVCDRMRRVDQALAQHHDGRRYGRGRLPMPANPWRPLPFGNRLEERDGLVCDITRSGPKDANHCNRLRHGG